MAYTSNPSMQGLIVCFAIRISNSAAQSPILIKHNFVPISSAICPLAFKTFCLKAVVDPYSWLYISIILIFTIVRLLPVSVKKVTGLLLIAHNPVINCGCIC